MADSHVGLARLLVSLVLLGWSVGLAHAENDGDGDATTEQAENRAKAQALVSAATELYFSEKFEEALPLFQQAYELYPRPKYIMNAGSILIKLDRVAEAANTYELFLRLPDRDRSKDPEVAALIKGELAPRLGRFKLRLTGMDGAESSEMRIYIDDRPIEAPVAAAIWVEPGKHRIRLEGSGFTARPAVATAVIGKIVKVKVKVKVKVTAAASGELETDGQGTDGSASGAGGGDPVIDSTAGPSDDPSRPGGGYRIAAWGTAGFTVASVGLAVVSHSRISSSEEDLRDAVTAYQLASGDQLSTDDACGDAETRTPNVVTEPLLLAVRGACDDGEAAATRANLFYGATAVLGVVSIYLFYKGYIASPEAEPARRRVQIQPTLTPQVVGAELTLRF